MISIKKLHEQRLEEIRKNKAEILLVCENHIMEANRKFRDWCSFNVREDRLMGLSYEDDLYKPMGEKGYLVTCTYKGLDDYNRPYSEITIRWDNRARVMCEEILGKKKKTWKTRLWILVHRVL